MNHILIAQVCSENDGLNFLVSINRQSPTTGYFFAHKSYILIDSTICVICISLFQNFLHKIFVEVFQVELFSKQAGLMRF